jgi:hypothetical protein
MIQIRKKIIYLLLILIVLALIFFLIRAGVFKGFFVFPEERPVLEKPEINLDLPELKKLKEMEKLEEILPVEGDVGRENPFLPYKLQTPKP